MIPKPKQTKFSSLFATHHLGVIKSSMAFHGYIPYGLGAMSRTLNGLDFWQGQLIKQEDHDRPISLI